MNIYRKTIKNLSKTFSKKHPGFKAKDLKRYMLQQRTEPKLDGVAFKFGRVPTDYMVQIDYSDKYGWETPVLKPFQSLSIHPFNSTLHYSFSCFEGMKAYLDPQGKIRLFRPEMNMARFNKSCKRIALPTFDETELLEILKEYIKVEKCWIPTDESSSLYIRPFAMSMANFLGVETPTDASIFLAASPVSNYFDKNEKIKLMVDETYWRGTPNNAASFKIAPNYGPTLEITENAVKEGYSQTIWTYQGNFLESGASNILMVVQETDGQKVLVTHPLDGSILPGITRDTILQLVKDSPEFSDYKVEERFFNIDEFLERKKNNQLLEVFMSGTAAVISQVDMITARGEHFDLSEDTRDFSTKMGALVLAIQKGEIEHQYSVVLD